MQRADLKLRRGRVHLQVAIAAGGHKWEKVAAACCGNLQRRCAFFLGGKAVHFAGAVVQGKPLQQPTQRFFGIQVEQHPVDGLKQDAFVMDILKLHERIARGVVLLLGRGERLLQGLPVGFRGGEGMVAIAHRKEHGLFIRAVLLRKAGGVCKRFQRAEHALNPACIANHISFDAAAAKHELKIVKPVSCSCGVCERLDDRVLRVVNQNEDVRQLKRGILADAQARRNALHNRAFRCADERFGATAVIVLLKVERDNKAAACFAIHGAAHEHKAFSAAFQRAVRHVAIHGGVNRCDALGFTRFVEIHFRQHQAQGGGRFADDALSFFPVIGLRGELIAGDDGPFFHGYAFVRQQDVGNFDTDGVFEHGMPPLR